MSDPNISLPSDYIVLSQLSASFLRNIRLDAKMSKYSGIYIIVSVVALTLSVLSHVHNTSNTIACLHILKGLVDFGQWLSVCNEFINFEFAGHVIVDEIW